MDDIKGEPHNEKRGKQMEKKESAKPIPKAGGCETTWQNPQGAMVGTGQEISSSGSLNILAELGNGSALV